MRKALQTGTFYTYEAVAKAKQEALSLAMRKGELLLADALVGVDIDYSDLNGHGAMVSVNGTAVKIRSKE